MDRRVEPKLIEDAREAVRLNPGYVSHGPELCPRDIIEAFELGVAWKETSQTDRPADLSPDNVAITIRNPMRSLKRETAHRLAELASDLECGLKVQQTIISDWTTPAERNSLGDQATVALAYQRLADAIREVLAAAEPRDLATATEIAEQMSAASERLSLLVARVA